MTMTPDALAGKAKVEIRLGDGASRAADQSCRKAEQHFIRAGKLLLKAKKAIQKKDLFADGGPWLIFLERHRIAPRTAQEHMALARGKTTLKQVRAEKSERARKSRKKTRYSNADSFTAKTEHKYTRLITQRQLYEGACELAWPQYFEYRDAHPDECAPLTNDDLAYVRQWTDAGEILRIPAHYTPGPSRKIPLGPPPENPKPDPPVSHTTANPDDFKTTQGPTTTPKISYVAGKLTKLKDLVAALAIDARREKNNLPETFETDIKALVRDLLALISTSANINADDVDNLKPVLH